MTFLKIISLIHSTKSSSQISMPFIRANTKSIDPSLLSTSFAKDKYVLDQHGGIRFLFNHAAKGTQLKQIAKDLNIKIYNIVGFLSLYGFVKWLDWSNFVNEDCQQNWNKCRSKLLVKNSGVLNDQFDLTTVKNV